MKKIRILFFTFLGTFFLLAAIYFCHGFDSLLFRHMTERFFVQSLENDALNLHFTLADPKSYHIKPKAAALPVYSSDAQRQSARSSRKFYEKLSKLDLRRLNEKDRYACRLLLSYLKEDLKKQDFPYLEEPLSPSSGMHSELLLLFAEYPFRCREDATGYLSLLESTEPYLEGLLTYENEKARAGLFMPREDAEAVISQCDVLLNKEQLENGTHFLQTTFAGRLEQLRTKKLLTEEEKIQLLAENDRILTTLLLPAYEKLGDGLLLLTDKSNPPGGLCQFQGGKDYYAWLVRHATGSSLDMDGIYLLLQKQFQKQFSSLQALLKQYRALTGSLPAKTLLTADFPLEDPAAILTDLQKRMAQDFPPISVLSSRKLHCTIRDVDPALEAFTSPAFYMTPPIDDLTHNTICINRSSTAAGLSLYTTLAHEGYPGHLYQTVYSSLSARQNKESPLRELLYFGGYVEGWAYYTERLSYGYATKLLSGADSASAAAILCEMAAVERDLQINLFSLLDMALHYYGAPKEDILRSLESFGLGGPAGERIYSYLRTTPVTYLKYYVGYLEMLALRQRAQNLWGEGFSPLRFHQFVLEAGPSDFGNLTRLLLESEK